MKKTISVLVLLVCSAPVRAAGGWRGEIPAPARESQSWVTLLQALKDGGMPYGAMAASARMLTFFGDLASKEAAYRSVVDLIDQGYPFSVNSLFVAGDLEARGDAGFVNSYNLAKYILNHEKGMERWARQYYEKMDGESFPKYQYYLAVQAYAQGKLPESIDRLRKILAADKGEGSGALAVKSARTLARIYFEKKEFEKAVGIYNSFLLKLNPIQPSDWLEAAWCDYYLKRYPEALGMLYNLESRAAGPVISLEKYTLRALIYRENCAVQSAEAMIGSFDRDFGAALTGVKEGASPSRFPALAQVETGAGSPFLELGREIADLQRESQGIDAKLEASQRGLARYLYDSELKQLQAEQRSVTEDALEHSAEELVTISEHLKFLKYDVARQKYDPDQVFRATPRVASAADGPGAFQVRWPQQGEFWRNERLTYKGVITQQCSE